MGCHRLNDGTHLLPKVLACSIYILSMIVKVLPDRIMAASTVKYGFVNGEETSMKAFAILHKGPEVRWVWV